MVNVNESINETDANEEYYSIYEKINSIFIDYQHFYWVLNDQHIQVLCVFLAISIQNTFDFFEIGLSMNCCNIINNYPSKY